MINITKQEIEIEKSFIKNQLVLKVVDIDKIIDFINLIDKTIIEY